MSEKLVVTPEDIIEWKKSEGDIPIAECPNCGWIPVMIQTFEPGEEARASGVTEDLHIIGCPQCELCLNTDQDIDLIWVGEDWMAEHGWIVDEESLSPEPEDDIIGDNESVGC